MGLCGCDCDPQIIDICYTRGDTYVLYGTYAVDKVPVNITGASIRMIVKTGQDVPDADALFTISTATGDILITDASAGQFVVTVPSSKTIGISAYLSRWFYNIILEIGSGVSGYSGWLGYSGFGGLSGNGLYRATIFKGRFELTSSDSSS